jgi:hypothetical protein
MTVVVVERDGFSKENFGVLPLSFILFTLKFIVSLFKVFRTIKFRAGIKHFLLFNSKFTML